MARCKLLALPTEENELKFHDDEDEGIAGVGIGKKPKKEDVALLHGCYIEHGKRLERDDLKPIYKRLEVVFIEMKAANIRFATWKL